MRLLLSTAFAKVTSIGGTGVDQLLIDPSCASSLPVGYADGSTPSEPPEANDVPVYVDPGASKTTVNITVALAVSIPIGATLLFTCLGCIGLAIKRHFDREKALDDAAAVERAGSREAKRSGKGQMSHVDFFTWRKPTVNATALAAATVSASGGDLSTASSFKKSGNDTRSVNSSAGTLTLTSAEEAERKAESGAWQVQRMLDGRPMSVVPKNRPASTNRTSGAPKANSFDAASNKSRGSISSSRSESQSGLSMNNNGSAMSESMTKKAQRILIQQQAEMQLLSHMPYALGLNGLGVNGVPANTPSVDRTEFVADGDYKPVDGESLDAKGKEPAAAATEPITPPSTPPLPAPTPPLAQEPQLIRSPAALPPTPSASPNLNKPPLISSTSDPTALMHTYRQPPALSHLASSISPRQQKSRMDFASLPASSSEMMARLKADAESAVNAVDKLKVTVDRTQMWHDVFDDQE